MAGEFQLQARLVRFMLATLLAVSVEGVLARTASAAPGAQLWAKTYNGSSTGSEGANDLAVSPDASRVFVTGLSYSRITGNYDFATVAYDAATGTKLWSKRFNNPDDGYDNAVAVVVSPDGGEVYVAGESEAADANFAIVAYDAATGTKLWAERSMTGTDRTNAFAVSPDGSTLYTAGGFEGPFSTDYTTAAFDAATGSRLWSKRYDKGGEDQPEAIALAPDGSTLFVTGWSSDATQPGTYYDYATLAYDAATGARHWVQRYTGVGGILIDLAYAIGVSEDGGSVFVTGESTSADGDGDLATVAYDTSAGAKEWARRYDGTGHDRDAGFDMSVSGSDVYISGITTGTSTGRDYGMWAYDAASGMLGWAKRYSGESNINDDVANDVGVSPDGSVMYVTGQSAAADGFLDYTTVASDASTGSRLWVQRYNTTPSAFAYAYALGVGGSRVFVTGQSPYYNYATVAYTEI
jgi:hypothetical protein